MKRKWSEGRVYIWASVNPSPASLHLFKGQASSNRAHPETCTEQLFICLFVLRKGQTTDIYFCFRGYRTHYLCSVLLQI